MKTTSRKLLLWLYPVESSSERWISWADLKYLLPELTSAGRSSLVRWLESNKYVMTQRLEGQKRLRLTALGVEKAKEECVALQQAEPSEWSLLIFTQAPKSDPAFRSLRRVLVEDLQAGSLSRGVYLYPRELPDRIIHLCSTLYRGSVVIARVSQWQLNDRLALATTVFMLQDTLQSYSGISSEIDQLLASWSGKKRLNKKQKEEIFLVFSRLFPVFETDLRLVEEFFPQVSSGKSLVARLQKIASQYFTD